VTPAVAPSPWLVRWAGLIPAGRAVLDLACGNGRHAVYLAGLGHPVRAVDIDLSLSDPARTTPGVEWIQADLEGAPWPCAGRRFGAIVVSRYLHRPLFDIVFDSLESGGVLIYETFALGQAKYGRPRNPAHLLLPGELLEAVHGRLHVIAFEDVEEVEQRRCMQRLCARRP
jgi:SAM-dependent methyltransferase